MCVIVSEWVCRVCVWIVCVCECEKVCDCVWCVSVSVNDWVCNVCVCGCVWVSVSTCVSGV